VQYCISPDDSPCLDLLLDLSCSNVSGPSTKHLCLLLFFPFFSLLVGLLLFFLFFSTLARTMEIGPTRNQN